MNQNSLQSSFYEKATATPPYAEFLPSPHKSVVMEQRHLKAALLDEPAFQNLRTLRTGLNDIKASHIHLDKAVVELGVADDIPVSSQGTFEGFLQELMPWKKGPFNLCGTEIDAEWRSDVKWERLLPYVGSLQGKRIADIGCNNGYFMLRMAAEHPEFVIGFEPVVKHWYTFDFLNHLAQQPNLFFELLGVEHIDLFPNMFDVMFCLGILYHHTDPVSLLRKMRTALAKGGTLIIDCQGIPGEEPVALTPQNRYAGATGIWFLPTESCLRHWLSRAGFQKVEVFYNEVLSPEEQRSSAWAPIKSLADFLDPVDSTRTVEGYPAPRRFYLLAR